MRRTPLPRSTPEQVEAWQRRSRERAKAKPGRAPGSTLAAKGERGRRLDRDMAVAFAAVDERDGRRCQFALLDPGHRCVPGAELHRDHLWGRRTHFGVGRRAKDWAIVKLCSFAHLAVTDDPALHRELRIAVIAERLSEWIEDVNTCGP